MYLVSNSGTRLGKCYIKSTQPRDNHTLYSSNWIRKFTRLY